MGGYRHQGCTVIKGLAPEIIHTLKYICYTGNSEAISGNSEVFHDKNFQLMGKTVYSNGDYFVVSSMTSFL